MYDKCRKCIRNCGFYCQHDNSSNGDECMHFVQKGDTLNHLLNFNELFDDNNVNNKLDKLFDINNNDIDNYYGSDNFDEHINTDDNDCYE